MHLYSYCQPALHVGTVSCRSISLAKALLVLQLSYISQREGGGPRAVEAAEAAHAVLMALGTDVSHGMLPESERPEDNDFNAHLAVVQPKASTSAGLIHTVLQ